MRPIQRTIWIFIVLLTLSSCQHDTDAFDGPALVDRFGDFSFLDNFSSNRSSVDFAAGETVVFSARFNKRVNFVVRITGTESGAVREITGFDSELNASNATWSGGTSQLPFFREEMCTAELLVPEEEADIQTLDIEVTGRKVYEGSLVTGFEQPPLNHIELGNFEFEFSNNTGRRNDGNAAEGDWYYYLEGTDNVVPNFFVGMIIIKPSIVGETYFPVPTTSPEDLYFNAFIQHDASPHTIAVIQFMYDTNNSGAFEDGIDAGFQISGDYPLNWVGWRHINHPMSALGMTEAQVSKIVAIRVLLISNNNTQPNPPLPVNFGIDFLTFTAGAPLAL